MKKTLALCCWLLVIMGNAPLHAQVEHFSKVWFAGGNVCADEPWELVFHDDFDGDSLDRDKWMTWYPYGDSGSDQCSFCRTHGEEGQVYRDENAVVEGGLLKLIVKKEPDSWYGLQRDYTSGMVHSRQAFTDYARYEIRCKIPQGDGFWPAFWVFGWSVEIDIFEFGTGKPNRIHTGFFKYLGGDERIHTSHTFQGPDFSKDFHLIALDYEPFFMHVEVDSVRVYSFPRYYTLSGLPVVACDIAPGPYLQDPAYPRFGDPVQVIANVAVGAENTPFTSPPPPETKIPNQMEIDYIKVYQRAKPGQRPQPIKRLLPYPNPTGGDIRVRLENFDVPTLTAEGALIDILDFQYRVKRNQPVEGEVTRLSTDHLSPGLYFLRLITKGEAYLVKFLKIK
ncbi:MAG: family 16 glycosylhydrolase [Saprospiraceae bacterium]|nr:family 16 glycosylhydrolase [Saprospiraceae bacterium]